MVLSKNLSSYIVKKEAQPIWHVLLYRYHLYHHYLPVLGEDEVLLYQYDFWRLQEPYIQHNHPKQFRRHQENDPKDL